MKIYLPDQLQKPSRSIFVQPGRQFSASDWLEADGSPKSFTVVFRYGMAEVADNLGNYMIDAGLAKRSPILLPEGVA